MGTTWWSATSTRKLGTGPFETRWRLPLWRARRGCPSGLTTKGGNVNVSPLVLGPSVARSPPPLGLDCPRLRCRPCGAPAPIGRGSILVYWWAAAAACRPLGLSRPGLAWRAWKHRAQCPAVVQEPNFLLAAGAPVVKDDGCFVHPCAAAHRESFRGVPQRVMRGGLHDCKPPVGEPPLQPCERKAADFGGLSPGRRKGARVRLPLRGCIPMLPSCGLVIRFQVDVFAPRFSEHLRVGDPGGVEGETNLHA
eukprot:9503944-Pyramimonas_sp.AAC.1